MKTVVQNVSLTDVETFRCDFQRFIKDIIRGNYVEPVSIVNNGYLHTLNASFDGLFLREQNTDSLLIANNQMNFGTIQPCIRTEDKLSIKKSTLHLGLFEICGYSILGFEKVSPQIMAEKTIKEFFTYYNEYLKLDPRLLCIHYFGGGTLREISGGLIKSDKYIEPDNFSVGIWKQLGLGNDQFLPEYSNETFLLHKGEPLREHHSGYRNDIFIKFDTANFEIATLNFISHQTIMKKGEIVGILPLPFYLREMAVGQERMLAAKIGSGNLYQLPYISPLLKSLLEMHIDEEKAMIFADALRVVHYMFSDGWTHAKLQGKRFREHRHELNKFLGILLDYGQFLNNDELTSLLTLNAHLQPWHPKLKMGIDITTYELKEYRKKHITD